MKGSIPTISILLSKIDRNRYRAKVVLNGTQRPISKNTFRLLPNQLYDKEFRELIEHPIPQSKKPEKDSNTHKEKWLINYGKYLFGLVFGDGNGLHKVLSTLNHGRIHIAITLDETAVTLWQMPWEYMHDGNDFIALHGRYLFSRTTPIIQRHQIDIAFTPLKILVIVSSPYFLSDKLSLTELDAEHEIRLLQRALEEPIRNGTINVEFLEDATLNEIGLAVTRIKPHIIHYTGHGYFDQGKQASFLALMDDFGDIQLAGLQELRPIFYEEQVLSHLRLVFLSGCQTAQTGDQDAFRSVSTGLLRVGVPSIMAMQFSILDTSATKFAEIFYQTLGQGESIQTATLNARVALSSNKDSAKLDWGIPALYCGISDLRLVGSYKNIPNKDSELVSRLDNGGLPSPLHFVGRTSELHQLRKILRNKNIVGGYLNGVGGVGKSSLVSKLIERPYIYQNDVFGD